MENDKPFKGGIEVVDCRTGQICKVACMSCIRGHRTTSCGIPVCRTKLFWTVKRPGRPSNTCTCRFSSSGRCRCMTARSACPHKAKKGEKRSGECRCDEQGRFCCVLEPEHWNALITQQKPQVDFFATREDFEALHNAPAVASTRNAAGNMPTSPPATGSCCGGAPATPLMSFVDITTAPMDHFQPDPQVLLTPRFGFMGIGGPQGNSEPVSDPMTWDGQVPPAPRDARVPYVADDAGQGSCCGVNAVQTQPSIYQQPDEFSGLHSQQMHAFDTFAPSAGSAYVAQPTFDFDRWMEEYYSQQLPGAICQKCGLNGCTCKNCPPPMQSYGTTSWAQSCGRKHAMEPAVQQQPQAKHAMLQHVSPLPTVAQPMQQQQQLAAFSDHSAHSLHQQVLPNQSALPEYQHQPAYDSHLGHDLFHEQQSRHTLQHRPPEPDFDMLDLDGPLPVGVSPVQYSDFLMSELDKPSHGWTDGVFIEDSRPGSTRPP